MIRSCKGFWQKIQFTDLYRRSAFGIGREICPIRHELNARSISDTLSHSVSLINSERFSAPSQLQKGNIRFKSKGPRKATEDSDGESSDEEEYDEGMEETYDSDGGRIKFLKMKSIRIDTFLLCAFKITRRRLEEAFLYCKIRVNGKVLTKKGVDLVPGSTFELFEDSCEGGIEKEPVLKVIVKKVSPINTKSGIYYNIVYSTYE